MNSLTILTENIWIDTDTDVVVISIDRTSIAFPVEEFLSFCDEVEESRKSLLKDDRYITGKITDGENQKEFLIRKPDVPDEYDN